MRKASNKVIRSRIPPLQPFILRCKVVGISNGSFGLRFQAREGGSYIHDTIQSGGTVKRRGRTLYHLYLLDTLYWNIIPIGKSSVSIACFSAPNDGK